MHIVAQLLSSALAVAPSFFRCINLVPYLHLTVFIGTCSCRPCSGVAWQSMDYTRWIALIPLLFMVPYAGPLMLWSTLMGCLDGLQGPHLFVCLCTCLHQLATWPFAQLQGPSFLPLPRWLRLLLADLWTVGHRYSIAACYAHVRAETGMYSRWCGMQSLPYQGVPRPHLPASSFFARPAHVGIGPCLLRIQIEWWTQLTDAWAGLIRE